MDKWLSIQQLSETTNIPETTVRRYTQKFDVYFRYENRSRGKKFHPESVELLQTITSLYKSDYDTSEIKERLSKDYAFTIEPRDTKETIAQPPGVISNQEFEEFKQQQEKFNQELLKQLQDQQDYIKNSIEKRDKELLCTLNEMQETKKELAATKQNKWWEFWK